MSKIEDKQSDAYCGFLSGDLEKNDLEYYRVVRNTLHGLDGVRLKATSSGITICSVFIGIAITAISKSEQIHDLIGFKVENWISFFSFLLSLIIGIQFINKISMFSHFIAESVEIAMKFENNFVKIEEHKLTSRFNTHRFAGGSGDLLFKVSLYLICLIALFGIFYTFVRSPDILLVVILIYFITPHITSSKDNPYLSSSHGIFNRTLNFDLPLIGKNSGKIFTFWKNIIGPLLPFYTPLKETTNVNFKLPGWIPSFIKENRENLALIEQMTQTLKSKIRETKDQKALEKLEQEYKTTVLKNKVLFVISASKQNVVEKTGGPFAAAIFESDTGKLVSLGVNLVTTQGLSILHAEMVAIVIAQANLKTYDLGGEYMPNHELVTSTEPCAMCFGAIPWSGVRTVITAAYDQDARDIGFDEGPKPENWSNSLKERGIEVIEGIERKAASEVLQFYRNTNGRIYNSRET